MKTRVDICNEALHRIGHYQPIDALDKLDPKSTAEEYCAAFFETARRETLRLIPWNFAAKRRALSLMATYLPHEKPKPRKPDEAIKGYPDDTWYFGRDWRFAYQYPADCLYMRRILPPRPVRDMDDPRFTVGHYEGETVILTDVTDAGAVYTMDLDDTGRFSPEAASLLAWRLAMRLVRPLGRSNDLLSSVMELYSNDLAEAQAVNGNEDNSEQERMPDWLEARL
jgi:hypothetical protein